VLVIIRFVIRSRYRLPQFSKSEDIPKVEVEPDPCGDLDLGAEPLTPAWPSS
jgi:hypothetical protein